MHQALTRRIRENALMHNRQHIDILNRLIRLDPLGSARKVAAACGLTQSTLSRILSGEIEDPRDKQLAPLARRYGLRVEQLRGREPINWDDLPTIPASRSVLLAPPQPNTAEDRAEYIPDPGAARTRLAMITRIVTMADDEVLLAAEWLDRSFPASSGPLPPGQRDRTF